MAYNSGYWEELEGSLRKQLAEARAENAALVAELQRMADEPPTLEEIAADLDKIEMLEKELTEARAEIEKYKMGKISPADYYSMAEAEEKLCKELAEARAEVEHWKGECSDLVRMAHEMRAEIDYLRCLQTLIDLQHRATVKAKDAQIESMKCCQNCDNLGGRASRCADCVRLIFVPDADSIDNWAPKEEKKP